MVYIFIDKNKVRILHLKKSLLGQYETSFVTKQFDTDLLNSGLPNNLDVVASALKETIGLIPTGPLKNHDAVLVLPQESFTFFQAEMPTDITPSVLESYLKEKARAQINSDIDNSNSAYLIRESEGQKKLVYYAITKEIVDSFRQSFSLLDLKLTGIVPESITYYMLFEKTLRANKKERIWYVSYDQNQLLGYIYDSYGLLNVKRWKHDIQEQEDVQKILHSQAQTYQSEKINLDRLILSGRQSEQIRQDTFTKNVGVWTNPLHRIIPHFYANYVKMLHSESTSSKDLPVLEYDMLIGAFIFTLEQKDFSLVSEEKKSNGLGKKQKTRKLPGSSRLSSFSLRRLPWKLIGAFLVSFGIVFAGAFAFSKIRSSDGFTFPTISLPSLQRSTPTPEPASPTPIPPTPTPTPSISREEINVKVLNGSGIRGKASEVKEFLNEKGYVEILTGNADSFDYETTVVQIKDDAEIRQMISDDIASQVDSPEFETLEDDDASDVILIIGTDFR